MPYAPGIEYHGDRYAFQGITGAGQSIAAGIDEFKKKREQLEKEQAFNDPIMAHAHSEGWIDDEAYDKYQNAPHKQKQSIANGLMANISSDLMREKMATQEEQFAAGLAQRQAESALHYQPWAPPPEIVKEMQEKGFGYMPNSPRSGTWGDIRKPEKWRLPEPGTTAPNGGTWDAKGGISYPPKGKAKSKAEEAMDKFTEASGNDDKADNNPGYFSQIATWLREKAAEERAPGGTDYGFGAPPAGTPRTVHVQTEAEALAQPSGTVIVRPDGSVKIRP